MVVPSDEPRVFGPDYVSANPVYLVIGKTNDGEYFVAKGEEKKPVLTIKPCGVNQLRLHDHCQNGRLVALLKNATPHYGWDVVSANGDKVFSASGNHYEVSVSLEKENSRFDHVDYHIKRLGEGWNMYKEDSSTVIADIVPPENNVGKFTVGVSSHVDYAFVATLFVIADSMKIIEPIVSLPVVGLKYTWQVKTELIFKKTSASGYSVSRNESRGREMFTVKLLSARKRLLLDAERKTIAKLKKKNVTLHDRCVVSCFFGETDADLKEVYSVYNHHLVQHCTNLNVTFQKEYGSSSNAIDFKVTTSWKDKTCMFFLENCQQQIAQMHAMEGNQDDFMVEVYPNVDCAFMASLVAAIDAMKSSGIMKDAIGHVGTSAFKVTAFAAAVGFELLLN